MKFKSVNGTGAVTATQVIAGAAGETIWVKRIFYSVKTAGTTLRFEDSAAAPVVLTPEISLALAGFAATITFGGQGFPCTVAKDLNYVVTTGGVVDFMVEYTTSTSSGMGPQMHESWA